MRQFLFNTFHYLEREKLMKVRLDPEHPGKILPRSIVGDSDDF
jgi:hypothetical protein